MLDVRETHAHTKDNDSDVYRAKNTEFIRNFEKAVPALFNKSYKERPKATCEIVWVEIENRCDSYLTALMLLGPCLDHGARLHACQSRSRGKSC